MYKTNVFKTRANYLFKSNKSFTDSYTLYIICYISFFREKKINTQTSIPSVKKQN